MSWTVAPPSKIIWCVLSRIACYEAGNMVNTNRFALLDTYVAPYCFKKPLNCKKEQSYSGLPLDFVYAKHKTNMPEFICSLFNTANHP